MSCNALVLCCVHAQVREIGNKVAPEPFRWTADALLALQEVRGAVGASLTPEGEGA